MTRFFRFVAFAFALVAWSASAQQNLPVQAQQPAVIYAACAVYGFSVGNNITLSPLIIQREFAPGDFPAIVALSTAVVQILYAFGPGLLRILTRVRGRLRLEPGPALPQRLRPSSPALSPPEPGRRRKAKAVDQARPVTVEREE